MQTTSIAFFRAAKSFLSLKASLSQIKKLLLPVAFLLSLAFFASPAAGQVSITSSQPVGSFYTLAYTVTFTTAQTGLSASNFSVTGSIPGASVGNITGSGTSYQVNVTIPNSFQSAGTVTLNMINGTGLSPGVTGLPVSGPTLETILYPYTGTLSLSSSNANPGYAKTGDQINYTLTAPNYVIEFWNVNVAGVAAGGESFSNSNSVQSSATLGSGTAQGAIPYSWNYTGDFNVGTSGSGTSSIIFDSVNPTISIGSPSVSSINDGAGSVTYNVTYADVNFNTSTLTTSNVTLNTTGMATGTIGLTGSGTSYTVTISNISGAGTLGISIGSGTASDKAGNLAPASGASPTFNVVNPAAPTTTSVSSNNNPSYSTAPNNSVAFTATVTSSGTVNGGTVTFTSNGSAIGGGTDVPVNSSGEATVTTSFNTAGVYTIVATYNGTSIFASSSSSPLNQQVNLHPTTINSITANSGYTNASPIQFTVNFGASITGLSTSNFSLTTTGAVSGASIASLSPSSGSTYTVTVNTGAGDGTIGLNLNNATGLTPGISTNLPFTGGVTAIDRTPPVATISAPSVAIVAGSGTSSVSYRVNYTDANFGSSNLTLSGITLNTTGTATGTLGISGSGTTYTVTISNISGNGTLGISVGAGHAVDLAGNTEASGAGPSSTVTVVPNVSPSINYAGPQGYAVNTAISPLTPSVTSGAEVFAGSGGRGVALDYNGNAYAISTSYSILMYPSGGGSPVTAYNANGVITNVAVAPISTTTSTLIFGIGGAQLESMDVVGGVFQAPVTIGPIFNGFSPVAATHPASGPDVVAVFTDNNSNINFTARTGGVYSAPAPIANAIAQAPIANVFAGGTALALNNYQGAVKLAFVGGDNNLYYSIYSGGIWSAVAPWATPNISISSIGAFALDAQGNVWYSSGTSLNEITPGATAANTVTTLPAAATGIGFDVSGNIYVNGGTEIEELQVPGNFQVTPALPAGLSINSTTGVISGTPTALTAANNYTVTATAGASNLTAPVNIQIVTTPTLSYGSPVNATVGTTITPITPTSASIMPQNYDSTPTTFASATAPTGLATDGKGNVYIAENGGSVVKIPAGGGGPTSISSSGSEIFGPIFVDSPGNIYLSTGPSAATINGFTIIPINPTPLATTITGSMESASGGVAGMGVDAAGNVYTAGLSPNIVYEYIDPLNSTPNLYGQSVAIPIGTGFTLLSGLAVDAAGDVYVTDAGAGTIDVIPTNRGQWTTLVSGLGAPANICIDGGGNLYFSDNNTNTIREIPAGSTTPVVIASGLGSITSLAIDGTGKLYAADNTNSIIDEFSPVGGYYINPQLPPGFSFTGATGAISGTPTVASAATSYTITAYNPIGSVSATQSIAVTATLPTLSYGGPLGFTTGSANVITPVSTDVSAQGYATAPVFMDYKFGQPWAVAVDTALNVYVADPWNFGTKSLAPPSTVNGPFYNPVFKQGNTAPIFYTPLTSHQLTGVAVDSTGDIYISKNQVGFSKLVPSTENTYLETVFPAGFVNQSAIDSKGNIFATASSGVIQYTSNSITTIASGFSLASGITVDGLGNIFVADYTASTLSKIPAGSSTPAVVATGYNAPWQLAADGTGNIFIADGGNGVIKEYPAGGGTVTTVISALQTPKGVAVDKNGVLYVADAGFGQVRKYAPTGGYYISPALPPGLSFNNSTGIISGTPTTVTPVKNYKITAYNLAGSTQTTVRFGVVAPSSNLAGLTVSAGTLSPAFATATTGYSVTVPYNTSQIAFTPTAADGNAAITINGAAVSSGSPSGAIALSVGANAIAIVVTASDNSSTQTYTVTVNRSGPSNNALLSNVGIGYVISGSTVEAVVTPSSADPNATVTVNGITVASGAASSPIPLSPGANSIIIQVTAQDGLTKMTYKITVDGPLSATSTLSSLTISAGSLSPSFSPGTTSYTDNVTNTVSSVTVTPTTTDPNATVIVNGTAVSSGTASGNIALAVGNTAIPTVVTAQDGVTTTTYTITVTRAGSSNAGLSALGLSSGSLKPAFATATTSYTASVANSISSITVTPTTSDPNATVKVNGTAVASGSASTTINLNVGANAITTIVTAQDGSTTKTYTVTVTRAPSTDAYLSNLTVKTATLSPAFNFKTLAYTSTVPNTTTSVTVTPALFDVTASSLTVNGVAVANKTPSGPIALVPGMNTINIVVTAQDGVTIQTYTISVTRTPLTIATLSNLKISPGTLSPVFASGTTGYMASVANTVASITVTPTATTTFTTITVNGTAVPSGTASAPISLNTGANIINVIVTAQDGVTKQTYTLTVGKGSNDAYLSNLTVKTATLSPAFNFKILSFTASVPNSTSSVTVTPALLDVTASSLKVNGTAVANKTASGPIALAAGPNIINVVIIAQDGVTTTTYTITITRAASTNAALAALTLSSGTLTPAFATATMSYTTSVANAISSIAVTPTTADPTAMVTVNGVPVTSGTASNAIALAVGNNTITTVITAQDGTTADIYTVMVNRALSSNDNLSNISLSAGTLTPGFVSGTTGYAAAAGSAANIKVTPTTADPTATITVNGTAVASGTASGPIPLNTGINTINVTVTAQDGVTKQTYTLTVGKGSNDAYLSNLTVKTATLSPTFAFKTLTYTSSVPNATSSVTVTPALLDVTASSLTVNGTAVANKTASGPITLAVGANVISIGIIAQDGVTTATYMLTITRAASGADGYVPIAIGTAISVTKPVEKPALTDDGIKVHQAISPNGDGINDFLQIDNISQYPSNKLTIMNRNGQLVYEAKGYDNSSKMFDGHSNKNGQMQLPGTYFYQLDYTESGIAKHKTGFIVLKY